MATRFTKVAILVIALGIAALAAKPASAHASGEYCLNVDADNLKLYESPVGGGWTVRDITYDWTQHFYTKPAGELFVAVLKTHKITTYCTRYFGDHNLTLISYMLTEGNQAPQGNSVGSETCVTFNPATLKIEWSDEERSFVLTDGENVIDDRSYVTKAQYEEILSIIKKYKFEVRCHLLEWERDRVDYWRIKPTPITRIDRPTALERAPLTTIPPSYPLVCRGARDALVGIKPERMLALTFQRSTYPAGVGLSPGQCSWLDRGVHKEEPDVLVHQVTEGRDDAAEYKWRDELKDPAVYWTFRVYNDGARFIVTSAKSGGVPKPAPAGMEGWESLGGNLGSGPAAAVQSLSGATNALHVFARGSDGALWTRSRKAGKWSDWTSLGGAIVSAPSAAAAFNSANLVVVARGTDNAVWFRHLNGTKWDEWKTLGGALVGSPAVTTRQGEQFTVFGVGTDGAIYQHSFDGITAGEWKTLEKTREGLGFLYGPAATAPSANQMEVYAVASDGKIYTKTWLRKCDCWSFTWELLGGESNGAPAAAYIGTGATILLTRGPDLDLQKARITELSLRIPPKWESLGGKLFATPAVVMAYGDGFYVFGVAGDNALWWRTFSDK